MKRDICTVAIIAVLACVPASFAADDPPKPEPDPKTGAEADPDLAAARVAISRQDWKTAAEQLQKVVARDPASASAHNLYAYAMRKGPNPGMDLVFRHYSEALRLDPKHRGAHEYIGEAYLMVGNLAKAKEHLGALDRLCFLPCDEYRMLKDAVAGHEARQKR